MSAGDLPMPSGPLTPEEEDGTPWAPLAISRGGACLDQAPRHRRVTLVGTLILQPFSSCAIIDSEAADHGKVVASTASAAANR